MIFFIFLEIKLGKNERKEAGKEERTRRKPEIPL